jgi:hypothetical protein
MTDEAATLTALRDVLAKAAPDVRLATVIAVLYEEGERIGIGAAKLNNNGLAEYLVSRHLGARPAAALHGPDAFDAAERGIELKNSTVRVTDARPRANFDYAFRAPRRDETDDEYYAALCVELEESRPGGHALTALERNVPARTYRLSAPYAARYLVEHLRAVRTKAARKGRALPLKLNIGGDRCRLCTEYHRPAAIAADGRRWDAASEEARAAWDWAAVLAPTAAQCKK